jgi:cobalt/nickel transport system permease protein
MHIPDGYLGPITCSIFYIIMIPIWYISIKKIREKLEERDVPLLSLLSAFSFIVMMFNWPVPDGTTAHMVGGALIAILMGPYVGVITVSIALLIQALIFGDGGITTYAANCFNMAVVLPLVAYIVFNGFNKFFKGSNKGIIIGSFLAGYIGINAAALLCGLEIGIQPLFEPGYCPYPFWLAIPAMLFAHLTIAGIIEGGVTTGVINYLYSMHPNLINIKSRIRGEDD